MQIVKAILIILICSALLGACGLKGPLYLPGEEPATGPVTGQDTSTDQADPVKKKKSESD